MRVSAPKQNQPPLQARSNAKPLAALHSIYPTKHGSTEDLETDTKITPGTRFAHDFSQLPLYPDAPVRLQAKLKVNTPGDIYEQEADRVAEQVTSISEPPLQRVCASGVDRCPKCKNEQDGSKRLQTKRVQANDVGTIEAPSVVQEVLRSSGEPLDTSTRQFMESRFGHDFSQVRVHTDLRASASAHLMNADAFTVGRDVVFGEGRFAPETSSGRRLLAHELTHVVQQGDRTNVKGASLLQRRETSEDEPSLDDDPSATEEVESEGEEDMEREDESDEGEASVGQSEEEPGGEMGLAQVSSQLPNGGSTKPKHPGLGTRLKKWFREQKAKLRQLEECNPFEKKARKKAPRGKGTPKRLITCVTKYDINQQQVGAGKQPEVQNQVTDRVFSLDDTNCTYIVRWDMKSIPDQMVISDNDTGTFILDTGMVRGTGQQQIQPPVNVRIRVIPNDGTLNPNGDPTVYSYDIIKICGTVRKSTTCYLAGIIPIGHRVEQIRFNPRANYRKKRKRVTRAEARRLLHD